MKKMFEGYIYVVVNPLITDYVKIGRTKTVAKRVKQLSTGSPMKYKVLHSELVINASQVEAHLHRVFNDVRQNGEWFKTNDIEKIKEEIALIQDKIRCEDEVGFGETIREKYQNRRVLVVTLVLIWMKLLNFSQGLMPRKLIL